jgi:hypothetical protein
MPFFLVTQTSLVEAQDEQEAAQTGVDRLRSGGQVTVAVKSDETTITHVVVAARVVTAAPGLALRNRQPIAFCHCYP